MSSYCRLGQRTMRTRCPVAIEFRCGVRIDVRVEYMLVQIPRRVEMGLAALSTCPSTLKLGSSEVFSPSGYAAYYETLGWTRKHHRHGRRENETDILDDLGSWECMILFLVYCENVLV